MIEATRARFEKWWDKNGEPCGYQNFEMKSAWDAFQAAEAEAGVVIEVLVKALKYYEALKIVSISGGGGTDERGRSFVTPPVTHELELGLGSMATTALAIAAEYKKQGGA